jgi:hypothetical protein
LSEKYRPGFITKSKEPPKLHEDDKVEATILDIVYEKSTFRDKEREQYKFDVTLDDYDDYPCKAWLTYYEKPGDRSHLGILVLNLCNKLERTFATMEDFRRAMIDYRKIYLRVSGFSEPKEKDDIIYPRFKVVPGHLPEYYTPSSIAEFARSPVKPEEPKISKKSSELFAAILELKPDLTPDTLNDLITAEIKISEGMFNYEAATFMVASNLGIPATAKPTKTTMTVEGAPQDPLDDDCEAIIGMIQTHKKDVSRDDVEKMIQAEVMNSGGMFGRKTAAILVARSLGIDLEKSGSPVST